MFKYASFFIISYLLYLFVNDKVNFKYFDHKNIIITGASSGIGASISEILSKKTKANLHLFARSFVSEKLGSINRYKCDCSDYDSVKNILNTIDNIDIVINCAGTGDWKYLHEMEIQEINNCLAAPLISSLNMTHLTLPKMIENNSGQIVFIQSPVILQPWGSCTAYSVSRWGMRGLSESLRADLYNTNISISEIILGRTESNYFNTNKNADSRFPKIGNLITKITPEEAANAVIKTIYQKKEYEYYPLTMKLVVYMNIMFPSIVRYLTFITSWNPKQL